MRSWGASPLRGESSLGCRFPSPKRVNPKGFPKTAPFLYSKHDITALHYALSVIKSPSGKSYFFSFPSTGRISICYFSGNPKNTMITAFKAITLLISWENPNYTKNPQTRSLGLTLQSPPSWAKHLNSPRRW